MDTRRIFALAFTPAVAGAIAYTMYSLQPAVHRLNLREIIQVGGWVVITLAFEFVALVPIAHLSRGRKRFRLLVFAAGLLAWSLFSLAWFCTAFGLPPADAIMASLPMSIAGIAICATFVFLWGDTHA